MKLNQALTKLRNLKSKVSRLETMIEECAVHYEDEIPPYDYQECMAQRLKLLDKIRELKTKIQVTNASTYVDYISTSNPKKSIAELILMNADLRSQMAFVNKQLQHSTEGADIWSRRAGGRSKEQVKKVFAAGCDKGRFQQWLNELEIEKENLDEVLGNANASTDLK